MFQITLLEWGSLHTTESWRHCVSVTFSFKVFLITRLSGSCQSQRSFHLEVHDNVSNLYNKLPVSAWMSVEQHVTFMQKDLCRSMQQEGSDTSVTVAGTGQANELGTWQWPIFPWKWQTWFLRVWSHFWYLLVESRLHKTTCAKWKEVIRNSIRISDILCDFNINRGWNGSTWPDKKVMGYGSNWWQWH